MDDVFSLNNCKFHYFVDHIYPIEFEIKNTTYTDRSVAYLDIHLDIDSEGRKRTNMHDKDHLIFSNADLASSNAMQNGAFLSEYSLCTSSIIMAALNGEMFVVKPRWSGDCFSVNIVRKLVLAMCSSSLHIISNTTIPL
jgi:hypothetical protein